MFSVCFLFCCLVAVTDVFNLTQETVEPPPDVDRLLLALRDPDTQIRQQAVEHLARVEVVSTDTIMKIVETCKSCNNDIAMTGFNALETLGAKATAATPFLVHVLLKGDEPRNYFAGRVLSAMGCAAAPAIPSLMQALRSTRPLTRAMGAQALGSIGADAAMAVPLLFELAAHDDAGGLIWSVEIKATHALVKIGDPAIPVVLVALSDDDDRCREKAAYILDEMAAKSRNSLLSANSLLRNAMNDHNAKVRVNAAMAYWELSGEVEEVRPILMSIIEKYLQDRRASRAVGEFPDVPSHEVHIAVLELRRLGADAAPAVGLLVAVLSDFAGAGLDVATVQTLGQLGAVANPAIERLRELTLSSNRQMRQAAEEALQRIYLTSDGDKGQTEP